MKTRIIKITECVDCPKVWQSYRLCGVEKKRCPPTGTPEWCPLGRLEEERDGGSRE